LDQLAREPKLGQGRQGTGRCPEISGELGEPQGNEIFESGSEASAPGLAYINNIHIISSNESCYVVLISSLHPRFLQKHELSLRFLTGALHCKGGLDENMGHVKPMLSLLKILRAS
jgi:hypothetical protein